jgi:hypothetical protein
MALIRLVKILLGGQFDIEMGTFYVFIEEWIHSFLLFLH